MSEKSDPPYLMLIIVLLTKIRKIHFVVVLGSQQVNVLNERIDPLGFTGALE